MVSVIRLRYIGTGYYPFVIMIWLGFLNETLSLFRIYHLSNNAVNSNIYVLIEYGLLLYQFHKWKRLNTAAMKVIFLIGLSIWILDNCVLNSLWTNNSFFRCLYSAVIVLLSISKLNRILIFEHGTIWRNAQFIICIAFILFYGIKSFVEAFNAFHVGVPRGVLWNMWIILYFVNAAANVLYAVAISCIRPKQEYTLPY